MGTLLFGLLFGLMLLGLPIAFSIFMSSVGFLLITQHKPLIIAAQRTLLGMDSFPLLAIPLFIFMGLLMESAGLSRRLIDWVILLVGKLPGALGTVTVVACAIFAALTGSGPATVAAIGTVMFTYMVEKGYSKETAAGLIATSGALGPIIPPSITMVIYGATMSLSIPKMFLGGVVPGLVIATALILANFVYAYKAKVQKVEHSFTAMEVWAKTFAAFPTFILPVLIMGGIYGGFVTPTESAALGVAYSLLLSACYGKLNARMLYSCMENTIKSTAMIGFLIGCSGAFGWILSSTRIPSTIVASITPVLESQVLYLLLFTLILFVVGCLMETAAAVIVLAPILVPVGVALGLDPLHLGVVFCINLVIGYVTPPFGLNLFSVLPIAKVSYDRVVRGTLPFMLLAIVCVMLFTFIPGFVTWLPELAFGR